MNSKVKCRRSRCPPSTFAHYASKPLSTVWELRRLNLCSPGRGKRLCESGESNIENDIWISSVLNHLTQQVTAKEL